MTPVDYDPVDDGVFDMRHTVAGDRWPPLVVLSFMAVAGVALLGYSILRGEVFVIAFMTLWVGGVAWSWPGALRQPWQLTLRGTRLS